MYVCMYNQDRRTSEIWKASGKICVTLDGDLEIFQRWNLEVYLMIM